HLHLIDRARALVEPVRDLPGPTGESNRLRLVARGTVLCLGPNPDMALTQMTAALAVGGRAVVVVPGGTEALTARGTKGLPVIALEGELEAEALSDLRRVAVVADAGDLERLAALRRALAARTGPIVPLVVDPADLAALVHERHLCIDTTAAGGNASLLAASGG
ncbi:MAG: bifunctional proline dehydrogenase/L-glutamate gamma-semialdehyde dehydrogenase, partial [Pseudomonadota bacterium]